MKICRDDSESLDKGRRIHTRQGSSKGVITSCGMRSFEVKWDDGAYGYYPYLNWNQWLQLERDR